MPVVESSIVIRASKAQLFDLSQDYYLRLEWDPFVRDIKFLDGAKETAVGVHVWVKSYQGLTMEVEYTTVERPDRVAMKMVKPSFLFEQFAGAWRFEDAAPGETTVRFRYSFKSRRLSFLLDPIIRLVFLRDIQARLRGLKHAAETTDILTRLNTTEAAT
jgi:ribosome-associated toxin RatA of RatAB toxin-antitoxin module